MISANVSLAMSERELPTKGPHHTADYIQQQWIRLSNMPMAPLLEARSQRLYPARRFRAALLRLAVVKVQKCDLTRFASKILGVHIDPRRRA